MTSIGNRRTTEDARASLFVDWSNIYIGRHEAVLRFGEDPLAVRVSSDLYGELKGLLGPKCLSD